MLVGVVVDVCKGRTLTPLWDACLLVWVAPCSASMVISRGSSTPIPAILHNVETAVPDIALGMHA